MSRRDISPNEGWIMSATSDQTFMVMATLRDDTDFAEFNALRDDEHKQLEVLRSEGRVGAHYVSPGRRATFIEVIAADEAKVAETLETLPFARFFEAEVYPTSPPDAAEVAHRARRAA
jgi:muconolactone delta-isomerase